jgi:putative Mn2+ efflux pump MntP
MENFLLVLVLMGLDGFLICGCLGGIRPARNLAFTLATMVGVCDGAALALGATLRIHGVALGIHWPEIIVPLAIASCGIYVLFLGSQERMSSFLRASVVFLPVLLSFDNFLAGLALGFNWTPIYEAALFSTVVSGGMALVGIGLGAAIQKYLRVEPQRLGGYGLLAAAVVIVLV